MNGNDLKRCTTCGKWKPIADFHRRGDTPDGHQYHCKVCTRHKALSRRARKQKLPDGTKVLGLYTRVPAKTHEQLKRLSDEYSMSISRVVSILLKYALDNRLRIKELR